MAKYKEVWEDFDDATIIVYIDTDSGVSIPLDPANEDYQAFLAWIAESNTPDPAYTAEEIAAHEAAAIAAQARAYVMETDNHITSYVERKAAKLSARVNSLKYKSLQRKRAVALGRV